MKHISVAASSLLSVSVERHPPTATVTTPSCAVMVDVMNESFFANCAQTQVNLAAENLGIVWDQESDMRYVESDSFGFGTIDTLVDENNQPFSVTLLPHNAYTRVCDETPISNKTVVAHCWAPKTADSKTGWMVQSKLWFSDNEHR